jgi:hypothetical protein
MPDLSACYFCGSVGAAESDAVPPALDPPAAVQQSVALCPGCRGKLTAVLEPIFEHGVDAGESADADPADADPADADPADADPADADADADDVSDGDSVAPTPEDGDDNGGSPPGEPASRDGDQGTPDDAGTADEDTETSGSGAEAPPEPPADYHTVLRFLENREFPVSRGEVEGVVASAYDIGEEEVGEILDAAVERGVLAEADDTLARSRERL